MSLPITPPLSLPPEQACSSSLFLGAVLRPRVEITGVPHCFASCVCGQLVAPFPLRCDAILLRHYARADVYPRHNSLD